jgi:hypothetical protein
MNESSSYLYRYKLNNQITYFEISTDLFSDGGKYRVSFSGESFRILGRDQQIPYISGTYMLAAQYFLIAKEDTCIIYNLETLEIAFTISAKIKDVAKCSNFNFTPLMLVTEDNRILSEFFSIQFENYILHAAIHDKKCYICTMGCHLYVFQLSDDLTGYTLLKKKKLTFNIKKILFLADKTSAVVLTIENTIYIANVIDFSFHMFLNKSDLHSLNDNGVIDLDHDVDIYWDQRRAHILMTSSNQLLSFALSSKIPLFYFRTTSKIIDIITLGHSTIIRV